MNSIKKTKSPDIYDRKLRKSPIIKLKTNKTNKLKNHKLELKNTKNKITEKCHFNTLNVNRKNKEKLNKSSSKSPKKVINPRMKTKILTILNKKNKTKEKNNKFKNIFNKKKKKSFFI